MVVRRIKAEDEQAVSDMIIRNLFEVNIKDYKLEAMQEFAAGYGADKIHATSTKAHMYVACEDKVIAGCGAISRVDPDGKECMMETIFVLPELQGQGIGAEIMKTLESDAWFLSARKVIISSSITACGFYEKFGYGYKDGIKLLEDEDHYWMEKFR